MPFPILFGTTVTTVLHYRADCDMIYFIARLGHHLGFIRNVFPLSFVGV